MLQASRIVFQDCKHAIDTYSLELQAEEFRINWITILTLLRSIGHVLDKVDKKISKENGQAIYEWWECIKTTKPEPTIFWEFIDKVRNEFLKTYRHSIDRNLAVAGPSIDGKRITIKIDLANACGGKITSPEGRITSYMNNGLYSGKYEKDLAKEALDWWKIQLDYIDNRIIELLKT